MPRGGVVLYSSRVARLVDAVRGRLNAGPGLLVFTVFETRGERVSHRRSAVHNRGFPGRARRISESQGNRKQKGVCAGGAWARCRVGTALVVVDLG